jgi:hypothetical protein
MSIMADGVAQQHGHQEAGGDGGVRRQAVDRADADGAGGNLREPLLQVLKVAFRRGYVIPFAHRQ